MTAEEMKAQAKKVIEALEAAGMEAAELMDFRPGEPLLIMYTDGTEMFTLELNVA